MSKKAIRQQTERDRENEYQDSFLASLSKVSTVEEARALAFSPRAGQGDVGHRRHANLDHLLRGLARTGGVPPYRLVSGAPLCPDRATLNERAAYMELFTRFSLYGDVDQADSDAAVAALSDRRIVDII